jgi:hypothetical protein
VIGTSPATGRSPRTRRTTTHSGRIEPRQSRSDADLRRPLVLRRRHLQQPACPLLRPAASSPADVRDRSRAVPRRPREKQRRDGELDAAAGQPSGLAAALHRVANGRIRGDRRFRPRHPRLGPIVGRRIAHRHARLPRPRGHGLARRHGGRPELDHVEGDGRRARRPRPRSRGEARREVRRGHAASPSPRAGATNSGSASGAPRAASPTGWGSSAEPSPTRQGTPPTASWPGTTSMGTCPPTR